eukprot:COSAG03_NODE_11066_length_613_cov_0.601167_1_plen_144_part_10
MPHRPGVLGRGCDIAEGFRKRRRAFGEAEGCSVGGDRFSQVRSSLLKSVSKCGARGIFSLRRQLQLYDRDGSGVLDREELYLALTDFKIAVSEDDVHAIFVELDRDDRGVVNYDTLLDLVAPRLTHDRAAVVTQSFNKVRSAML